MPHADFGTTPCLVSAISSRPIRRMPLCDACVLLCSNKSASTALQSGISSRLRQRSKAPRAHARGILTRIIHERFCCNRRSAALAREASFVKRISLFARDLREKRDGREPAGLSCLFGLFGLFG